MRYHAIGLLATFILSTFTSIPNAVAESHRVPRIDGTITIPGCFAIDGKTVSSIGASYEGPLGICQFGFLNFRIVFPPPSCIEDIEIYTDPIEGKTYTLRSCDMPRTCSSDYNWGNDFGKESYIDQLQPTYVYSKNSEAIKESEVFNISIGSKAIVCASVLDLGEKKLSIVARAMNGTEDSIDIYIPLELMSGEFNVFVDGVRAEFQIDSLQKSSWIIVKVDFPQGERKIDIISAEIFAWKIFEVGFNDQMFRIPSKSNNGKIIKIEAYPDFTSILMHIKRYDTSKDTSFEVTVPQELIGGLPLTEVPILILNGEEMTTFEEIRNMPCFRTLSITLPATHSSSAELEKVEIIGTYASMIPVIEKIPQLYVTTEKTYYQLGEPVAVSGCASLALPSFPNSVSLSVTNTLEKSLWYGDVSYAIDGSFSASFIAQGKYAINGTYKVEAYYPGPIRATSSFLLGDEPKVSVMMKQKGNVILVSVKNSGQVPIYGVEIFRYINDIEARGWKLERPDSGGFLLRGQKPLSPNSTLIIMINSTALQDRLEWRALDKDGKILAGSILPPGNAWIEITVKCVVISGKCYNAVSPEPVGMFVESFLASQNDKDVVKLIKNHYKEKGIIIFDASNQRTSTKCKDGECTDNYGLYLLVSDSNLNEILSLGYRWCDDC